MKTDGLHANYTMEGEGPPALLIHGMAASLWDWTYLAPALAAGGYRACALDLLGHGGSAKPEDPSCYHIEAMYQHFLDWLDSLKLGEGVTLVGHSLGGYLSILLAARQPERVRCMVLIDPYYEIGQLSRIMRFLRRWPAMGEKAIRSVPLWIIQTVIRWIPNPLSPIPAAARRQIASDYKRASPHFVYITRDIPDLTHTLSQVLTPTLVIWGERDQTLQPASFPRLVRELPAAIGYPIPGSGHQPHLSQPHLVNRQVLEFLKTLE